MSKPKKTLTGTIVKVIAASSLGTLIEWYDFYIFGSLAVVISTKFFPSYNPTAAFLSTLATFAAGFVVRPFGAVFFGRLGDLVGRKYTFMATLLLMGGATFLIGCVPGYDSIGFLAPFSVLLLRLLQGLALGGEYGGAATYVAEHTPSSERGFWTSWIQTTATVGLFVSLMVILATRTLLSAQDFEAWGWRIPFWISIVMVAVSYLIRKNMDESPAFVKARSEGKTSRNPLKESFGNRYNLKYILLALIGATMGQGVVWYTGQFYAMNFLKTVMNVDSNQVDSMLGVALLAGTPFFVFFGWISDKLGRKRIMMLGMFLAIFSYRPIYRAMYETTDLKTKSFLEETFQETPSVRTENGKQDSVWVRKASFTDGTHLLETETLPLENGRLLQNRGSDPGKIRKSLTIPENQQFRIVFLIFLQVLLVTMVYGPIAAFLVEMFPVRIRYTSMSLPYHVGNGVFGGLLPAISTYLVSQGKTQGHPDFYLDGLWYPILISSISLVVGILYLPSSNTTRHD